MVEQIPREIFKDLFLNKMMLIVNDITKTHELLQSNIIMVNREQKVNALFVEYFKAAVYEDLDARTKNASASSTNTTTQVEVDKQHPRSH